MRRMTIRDEGLSDAVKLVAGPGQRSIDLSIPLQRSIPHWQDSERRRFTTTRGLRRDTDKWIQEKRRRGLDPRTMRATGMTERALTTANRSKGVIARATRTTLVVGIRPGRSDLYAARIQAKRGRNVVRFDKLAKQATSQTVLSFILSEDRPAR